MEKHKAKTEDLPGIQGKGVAPLKIPNIDKAIRSYENKKEKRCEASPGEISAKRDLKALLHEHAAELPLNEDGQKFYRYEGVDYILEETLKRKRADDGEVSEE